MYCVNCGANNANGVRFCASCGTPVDPEATRVAAPRATFERQVYTPPIAAPTHPPPIVRGPATDEIEQAIFRVRPTFLFIGLGYGAAALGAILLTILLARFAPFPAYVSLLLSLFILLVPAFRHLKRNSLSYTLTDSKIEIDQGLVSRQTRNIPLRNIQDVTVSASLMQRLLGFGDLVIDNASELGGSTIMRNIPAPRRHAELLLRELRRWR